jgi:YidC/Oxa1 family membrane protein insertase
MKLYFKPLYGFVSGVIVLIHDGLAPIFGTRVRCHLDDLPIMGLVVLIRIILIPLFVKQIKSQRALTALASTNERDSNRNIKMIARSNQKR